MSTLYQCMNEQDIFEFIKKNLKFTMDQHYSDGYHDSNYVTLKLTLTNPATGQDEEMFRECFHLPDEG